METLENKPAWLKLINKQNSHQTWTIQDEILIGARGTLYVIGGFIKPGSNMMPLEDLLSSSTFPKNSKIAEWLKQNRPELFEKLTEH